MNELRIIDGTFMGYTLRRTQIFLPDRKFIAIPVTLDKSPVAGPVGEHLGGIGAAGASVSPQQMWGPSSGLTAAMGQNATQALVKQAQKELLQRASPNMVLPTASDRLKHVSIDSTVTFKRPVTPLAARKSWWQTIKDMMTPGFGQVMQAKIDYADIEKRVAAQMGTGVHMAMDTAAIPPVVPRNPHPCHSAYIHCNVEREIPLFRVDAQPAFFLDDTVGKAMVNSIDTVCDTKHGEHLGDDVRAMRDAVYRPLGLYKPDGDGAWTGDKESSSLFFRQTVHLDNDWDLDIRHSTGVYQAKGRTWLGVFVHAMAVRNGRMPMSEAGRVPMTRQLAPTVRDEKRYVLKHRGQVQPEGLFFDLFVPCEPEVITEEWGWGEDLETLVKARENNATRDARERDSASVKFPANTWDKKAVTHKSERQLNHTQIEIDHEAQVLGNRYMDALKERERARRVLYSYAWKAMMLAIMECRQLTVERK